MSVPFPPYTAEVFLGAESQGTDERAPALMARMGKIIEGAMKIPHATVLRTQMGATCGDGAMCRGGVDAEHKSGASMNLLWSDIAKTEDDNGTWDAFHLFSQSGSDALTSSEMGSLYIKVLKRQEYLFALGQGQVLRKRLAEYLEQPHLRILAVCGHRKIGYISGGFGRWLQNFRVDYDAYNLRMRRALNRRGKYSFKELKESAEEFARPMLVVFVLGVNSGMEEWVQPTNLRCQDSADLPMERWRAFATCVDKFRQSADQIEGVRVFLRVVLLLNSYLADSPASLQCYWYATCLSPKCSLLHSGGRWHALAHLFPIFYEGTFQGCELSLRVPPFDGKNKLYHPACRRWFAWKMPHIELRTDQPSWLHGTTKHSEGKARSVMALAGTKLIQLARRLFKAPVAYGELRFHPTAIRLRFYFYHTHRHTHIELGDHMRRRTHGALISHVAQSLTLY